MDTKSAIAALKAQGLTNRDIIELVKAYGWVEVQRLVEADGRQASLH
jgi:uncharacterized protein YciW